MKNTVLTSLVSAYLFVVPIQYRFNATSSPQIKNENRVTVQQRIEEKKALQEQKRLEIRKRIEEKRATRGAQLSSRRKERVRYFFERIVNKLEAHVLRLDKLIERIESRLLRIEEVEGGIDTASIKTQVENSRDLLNQTSADIEAAKESLDLVLEANDPKAAFEVVKETLNGVKDNLKEIHSSLVKVIGDITGLRVGNVRDVEADYE